MADQAEKNANRWQHVSCYEKLRESMWLIDTTQKHVKIKKDYLALRKEIRDWENGLKL